MENINMDITKSLNLHIYLSTIVLPYYYLINSSFIIEYFGQLTLINQNIYILLIHTLFN